MTNNEKPLKLQEILNKIKETENKMQNIAPEEIEQLGELYQEGINLIKAAETKINELETKFTNINNKHEVDEENSNNN